MLEAGTLVVGIIVLALSADKFVEGAAVTARRTGIPPLLVGMLVLGFGSSLPELVVSVLASAEGKTGLALGNAMGSNLSNIGLILGLTAVLSPIAVRSSVLKRELPILLILTTTCSLLLLDGVLSRSNGIVLTAIFFLLMTWSVYAGLRSPEDQLATEVEQALEGDISGVRATVYLIGGLIFLVISSQLLVWGGVGLARLLGVSDLIIGLTIVALGTSLPELASSIVAVRRNEHDIALGNVIGSNLFNTSIVIGIAGLLSPAALEPGMLTRDIPALATLTIILYVFCRPYRTRKPSINRKEGGLLLVVYLGYYLFLFLQTSAGRG